MTISNRYVRVFKVEVPPKAETLYHQHDYDYLYVAIGDADVTSTRLHEKPVQVRLKDGEVEFSKGPFAHKALNNSAQPFRNVTIELLQGVGTPKCGIAGGDKSCGGGGWGESGAGFSGGGRNDGAAKIFGSSGGGYGYVVRTDRLTVNDVETHGQAELPPDAIPSPKFLLVAVTDLRFKIISQNGTQEIDANPGDVYWNEQPGAKLAPLSNTARFLLFSFSDAKPQ